MEFPSLAGHYDIGGWAFSIVESEGRLLITRPGVPAGFESPVEWTSPSTVRVVSGPFASADLSFTFQDGRVTGGAVGGVIPITVLDEAPTIEPGDGLLPPAQPEYPEASAVFAACWESRDDDGLVHPPAGYPIHTLVQWLMAQGEFIFHGSNRTGIEEFQPRRESMELKNLGGRGNLGAVYGTHDGLWAMFFSVVDRSRIRGSIRNGVNRYMSADGRTLDVYRFSVEEHSLAEHPFTSGALYMLPREGFQQIAFYPGGPPSNEWACFTPVRPVGKLLVTPDDFPFTDQVGGHDDGELIELSRLQSRVLEHVATSRRIPGGIRLDLDDAVDSATVGEWLRLGRLVYPDVNWTAVDPLTVELSGPVPFIEGFASRLLV